MLPAYAVEVVGKVQVPTSCVHPAVPDSNVAFSGWVFRIWPTTVGRRISPG
jgi:hypothetical protein